MSLLGLSLVAVAVSSCGTARDLLRLRQVDFRLDRVSRPFLAGIDLQRIRSYEDLGPTDALRLLDAIRRDELPFNFILHVEANNPSDNAVHARLVEMDWILYIQDRETVSGVFTDEVVIPPGVPTDIPIPIELDLLRFFQDNARDLFELAQNVAGQGGETKQIKLDAGLVVRTPLGPMRYPGRVTIASGEVGVPASQ